MRRGSWLATMLLTGTAVAIGRSLLLVVHVQGASMVPTFREGEAVLVARRVVRRPVRRDDLVVCRLPEGVPGPDTYLVKRVAAVGGDPMPTDGSTRVPPGQVFVSGDGERSYDSYRFGPIPLDHVVGHVVARLTR